MRDGHDTLLLVSEAAGAIAVGLQHTVRLSADAAARAVAREARSSGEPGPASSPRRLALQRMAEEVGVVQTALSASRTELAGLVPVEAIRPLTPDELDQVRALRWRTEQLRWQLIVLRDQLEQVRGEPSSAPPALRSCVE